MILKVGILTSNDRKELLKKVGLKKVIVKEYEFKAIMAFLLPEFFLLILAQLIT